MSKRLLLLALSVALLGSAAASWAADALPDPRSPSLGAEEKLPALLERMRLEQAAVETLEADFTQLKESEFLLTPAESTGVFSYAAPDRVRWEYRDPNPISLLVRDEMLTTWYRDLGRVERVEVGKQSQRLLEYLGAGSSVIELLEYFDASLAMAKDESQPYRLELEPRFARIAKRLREMILWVDPELFLVSRLRLIEADGDVTEYRFDRLRVNQGLPLDRFDLLLPSDVVIETIDLESRLGLR